MKYLSLLLLVGMMGCGNKPHSPEAPEPPEPAAIEVHPGILCVFGKCSTWPPNSDTKVAVTPQRIEYFGDVVSVTKEYSWVYLPDYQGSVIVPGQQLIGKKYRVIVEEVQ